MRHEWMGLEELSQPALDSSSGAPECPQLLPAGPGWEQPQGQ